MTTATATFEGDLAAVYHRQAGADCAFGAALASLLAPADRALPVATSADRTVWGPDGSADPVAIADVLARADEDLGRPWGVPLATAAARIHDDGDRVGWETVVFERQFRLARAAVAAAHHADDPELGPAWLAEVLDGVWLICEQSTWCWPAHDDAFRERGSVLPTVTAPYLDLGAGEAVALLTWVDQLLGTRLEARYPGIRSRIRHEARVRVFQPFTDRRDWHWLGLDGDVHNWNPWIHGNVITAALRLLDDASEADERARIIALAIEGIDRYVSVLPADGAIDEGYAYWWNGACRALEALDIVRHATGGVLDASGIPALRETVAFPHRMHLGGDWYLNLADGQARVSAAQPWHALQRAARNAGDTDAAAHAASHRIAGTPAATEHEGFGRLLRGITDPAWVGVARETSPFPRDVWLPSTEVLLAREHGGTARGLTVAVKGGHNGEHHNHNDVGSFVVASDGVPVIVDAGRPTYTLQTFGPGRYDIWTMQSGWHNVPVIGGVEQSPGAEFAASDVEVSVDDASMSLDISGAYAGAAPWRRTVRLVRETRRVVIEDAWPASVAAPVEAPRTDAPTQVRMLLAGDVRRDAASVTVTPLDGATPVRISWPAGVEGSLVVRELDDPVLSSVWGARLTRLDLDVTTAESVAVTVELDLTNAEDAR
ncbi:heparinase II/III family protein [Microbacterium sp. NPDC056057]|uniref:heparinase II/III domain-containing protein n=1 Tax=Microbacterium sp. NPDC056057 TaxID=3345699 RepID=UPI0035D88013